MVYWTKLLCLIAYAVMVATVGRKIYDELNKVEEVKKPIFWKGITENKTECDVYIDKMQYSNIGFEDMIATHEAFVHRHLHNKTSQVECFMKTGTDEYKLIKYIRNDSISGQIETVFLFERRKTWENDQCYRVEYSITIRKLSDIIVSRQGEKKCLEKEKPKTEAQISKKQPVASSDDSIATSLKPFYYLAFALFIVARTIAEMISDTTDQSADSDADETVQPEAAVAIETACEATSEIEASAEVPVEETFIEAAVATVEDNCEADTEIEATVEVPEVEYENIPEPEVETLAEIETETPVDDDQLSNNPEEIAVFTVPVSAEVQSEVECDIEAEETQNETDHDQHTPVDMEMSEEGSFEYIDESQF